MAVGFLVVKKHHLVTIQTQLGMPALEKGRACTSNSDGLGSGSWAHPASMEQLKDKAGRGNIDYCGLLKPQNLAPVTYRLIGHTF